MYQNTIYEKAKKRLEILYDGRCDLFESKTVRREGSFLDETIEMKIADQIPCRISYLTTAPAGKGKRNCTIEQKIKLFFPPDTQIKEGSSLMINQNGEEKKYRFMGACKRYATHLEAEALLDKEWS